VWRPGGRPIRGFGSCWRFAELKAGLYYSAKRPLRGAHDSTQSRAPARRPNRLLTFRGKGAAPPRQALGILDVEREDVVRRHLHRQRVVQAVEAHFDLVEERGGMDGGGLVGHNNSGALLREVRAARDALRAALVCLHLDTVDLIRPSKLTDSCVSSGCCIAARRV
jgi:hypothetical protein